MKTYNKAGFSLIELLVALSILAVVAAIIVPRFLNVRQSAAYTTTSAQQKELQSTLQKWFSLGGSVTGAVKDGDYMVMLNIVPSGSPLVRTGAPATCIDSSGNFGSSTISLALPAAGTFASMTANSPQGFYYGAGTAAGYSDGAGQNYTITVGTSGGVAFTKTAGTDTNAPYGVAN